MPLQPRFRGTAQANRLFVDREGVFTSFAEELEHLGGGPRVLNLTGVGGIGKSRLLRELRERSSQQFRTVMLDLQVPTMRQQEDALAVLRAEFSAQEVRFDRFDIAYAVLWQRLHPHLPLNHADLPFVQESEILGQIVDSASGVPIFGSAVGLFRLMGRAASGTRRRQRLQSDTTLRQLDDLTNAELVDAVTYLFAEDLRAASSDRKYVVFVDAYEALVPAPARSGRTAAADTWLRDLTAQLDQGLVVLASREPVGWQAYEEEWMRVIRPFPLDGLPLPARRELLTENGVTERAEIDAVAQASAGVPFYLMLAVDTSERTHERPSASLISSEEIVQRFLQHVSPDEVRLLELLSAVRTFDFEVFQTLATAFDLPSHRIAWETLTAYSFVYPAGPEGLRLHQLMAAALSERLSTEVAREVHALLRRLWDGRAAQEQRDEGNDTAISITFGDGSTKRTHSSLSVRKLLRELRALMYQENIGTWFTAAITIDGSLKYETEFDYDSEPEFTPPIGPGSFAQDMKHFPRDEEHTPDWLREKLEQARATK